MNHKEIAFYARFKTQISNLFYVMKSTRQDWRDFNDTQLKLKQEIKTTKKIAKKQLMELEVKQILRKMDELEDEMMRLRIKAWQLLDETFPKSGARWQDKWKDHLDFLVDPKEFKELIIDFDYLTK